MRGRISRVVALGVVVCCALWFGAPRPAYPDSSGIVISQVYGGGGNAEANWQNDFIELFNTGVTAVNVTGWSVQYAPAAGATWQVTPLSGTIEAGHYSLVQEAAGSGGSISLPTPDATGSTEMSATAGKVVLVSNTTAQSGACPTGAVDFVGYGAAAGCFETSPTSALSNTTAAIRSGGGCTDTNNNSADFAIATPTPRNSASPGALCTIAPPSGADVVINQNGPASLIAGYVVTYTVTYGNNGAIYAAGVVLTDTLPAGITPANITGDGSGLSHTDSGNARSWTMAAPLAAGETHSFTLAVRVPTAVADQIVTTNMLNISTTTGGDDPANNSHSLAATEYQVLRIGAVQGATGVSPKVDKTVVVRGVVYAPFKTQSSAHVISNAFFMQSAAGADDGNAATSDGIYIYTGSSANIGNFTPAVGDEIVLMAQATEHSNLTELSSPFGLVEFVEHHTDLDAVVPASEMVKPAEPLESMRVKVTNALIVAPTYLFVSTNDTEFYAVSAGSPIAQRSDPYTRRVYRDQYAVGDTQYLISIQSGVLKAKAGDYETQLPAASVYDRVNGALVGPLFYAFSRFTLEVEQAPAFTPMVDATTNYPPVAPDRLNQFSIATTNVENLYDYQDDPTSPCDFNDGSNTGCPAPYPGGAFANPPFDYPAASEAAYLLKLQKLANQIINGAHSPDIMAVEEAENQDICTGGGEIYGACTIIGSGNPDGKLDVLQDLAREIFNRSAGAIQYDVAGDRAGGDYRGIIVGYMYRSDRVELAPAAELGSDPVLGPRAADPFSAIIAHNSEVRNPKALQALYPLTNLSSSFWLYDRRPQAALFRVHRHTVSDGDYVEVYTIGNHFKSGPDSNIGLRTDQARYNALLVADILAVRPAARVVVLGDLNVYPDGGSGNQLQPLYAQMSNTYYNIPLPARYSYTYQGVTQTLDQIFASGALTRTLVEARTLHANADWALQYKTNADLGILPRTSDHDPTVDTFVLTTRAWWQIYLPLLCQGL